jgi:plastocyanin
MDMQPVASIVTRVVSGVGLVLVLASCGGGDGGYDSGGSPPPGGGPLSVSIVPSAANQQDNAFDPNPLAVAVGDTVTWTNTDGTQHTVTSDAPGTELDSGLIAPGGTYEHTFTSAGTFTYHCSRTGHQMTGTIIVM